MARALSDILKELDNVYNPQREVYNKQITLLPDQQLQEEKGLEASKRDAFDQITTQANRRGLYYSGIPVAEEQRYTGQNYLPAVANMRNNYSTRRFNLRDALAKITQDQYLKGQDIYQSELNRDEAARAARAGGGGGGLSGLDFGGGQTSGQVLGAQTDPIQQAAYNDVYSRVNNMTAAQIKSDYLATLRSANYGNVRDKYKIQLYNQFGYKFALPVAKAPAPAPTRAPSAPTQVRQQLGGSSPSLVSQLRNAFSF